MLTQFFYQLSNLLRREEGQDLAEYAILIALIALVVLVAVIALGTNISSVFASIGAAITTPLSS